VAPFTTSRSVQLGFLFGNYKKKSTAEKMKEVALSIFFLRPIVDAYRVATAEEDDELAVSRLAELIVNKGIELATENIPGCVLQLSVWLSSPEDAGTFALVSIGISALTTG